LVEGTCDEIGRRHVWVALGPEGPRSVTFATRLGSLERPSDLAERLPKVLIHRNVPGEPVHAFLRDFDRAWATAAPYASLGARQRWITAARSLSADWPLVDGVRRWRQGEITVRWSALRPNPR
ncbi:MAG TPA: class I SAM-dependent methyltransferase, partial [Streptomyces sp.]